MIYLSGGYYDAETLLQYVIQDLQNRLGVQNSRTQELSIIYTELRKQPRTIAAQSSQPNVVIPINGPQEVA